MISCSFSGIVTPLKTSSAKIVIQISQSHSVSQWFHSLSSNQFHAFTHTVSTPSQSGSRFFWRGACHWHVVDQSLPYQIPEEEEEELG